MLKCKKIVYLFWIWNFINSSKQASCADNKTKMPDVGETHFFMKSHFSPSLWVTVYKQNIYSDTHSGSLRSNSIGEGGRLGDCQNRPEKRGETLFVTIGFKYSSFAQVSKSWDLLPSFSRVSSGNEWSSCNAWNIKVEMRYVV